LFAPIFITVYDRLEHLRQCIDSLKKCPESEYTTLYIASDCAAIPEHENAISNVREYIKTIDGFYKIIPILRDNNLGGYQNATQALFHIFEQHETVIAMEDDVIVGKGFLNFINDGLIRFKDEPSVIGVCAYLPPGIYNETEECFFLQGRSPYGFGMWRDKEKNIYSYFDKKYINKTVLKFDFFRKFERTHPHVARSIPLILKSDFKPIDILTAIIMQDKGFFSYYPPTSISASRGNDGSGLHSGVNRLLQNQEVSDEIYTSGSVIQIEALKEMEKKIERSYRAPMIKVLNYFIYFTFRLPGFFSIYTLSREKVKKARLLLIK